MKYELKTKNTPDEDLLSTPVDKETFYYRITNKESTVTLQLIRVKALQYKIIYNCYARSIIKKITHGLSRSNSEYEEKNADMSMENDEPENHLTKKNIIGTKSCT